MKRTHRTTRTTSLGLILALAVLGPLSVGSLFAQEENRGFDVFSGRVTFQRYCASCHGPEAEGDGNIAQYLKVEPSNLTLISQKYGEFPAEQVRKFIDGREPVKGHGTREMPVWGEVFQSTLAEPAATEEAGEERADKIIGQLLAYIESIQATY